MAKRKPTVGEKAICDVCGTDIDRLRKSPMFTMERKQARRIDRVVRQAFRDGRFYEYQAYVERPAMESVKRLQAKYGVKP